MPLHVKCPACGAKLKAPEDRIGKKARCNKCNTSFRIPKDLPRDAATDAAKSRPGGTALPPLSDLDDAIPMATAADDLETPPLADATPTPPGRPFDSGESPPKKVEKTAIPRAPADRGSSPPARRNATPPSGETPARGKSKPVLPPTPANPPPPNAEPEILSLEDDGPPQETHTASGTSIPTVSDSLAFTGDPFVFGQARPATKEGSRSSRRGDRDDQLQKKGPAGDRSSPRETLPEDDDEPPRPRYVRPGEKNSGKQTLLLAAVLGLLSIGALAAAIVVLTNRKHEEPPTAKKEQKPEEPAPPAPAEKGGAAAPPVQQPAPAAPPKPNPQEPAKKDSPEPPKKDSKQPPPSVPRTAVLLELPPKLPGFQLGKLSAKPELAQRPTGSSIAIEVPFEKIERVFAPQNRTTQDVIAVWVSNPGFNGKGQQLSVDSYSSTTGRLATRFAFDGDGTTAKCDVSTDAARLVAAGPDGKLAVWDIGKKTKMLDAFDPFAEKPDDRKSGLAAVFFGKTPAHILTVTTAGVVHLHDVASRKTLATFTPPGPLVPNRVSFGRSVAADDGRTSLVLAVGGVVYQIAAEPQLTVVQKQDLEGNVGRSLALGVAGNPGRITYAFETDNGIGKKERAIMFSLPGGKPEFRRWQDAAGEPLSIAWAGTDMAVIATTRGAVWAEYDTESRRFQILAMAESNGGKAIHTTTERAHWYLVPNPANPMSSLFVELGMPPSGLIDYRNAVDAKKPVQVVKLDALGLSR